MTFLDGVLPEHLAEVEREIYANGASVRRIMLLAAQAQAEQDAKICKSLMHGDISRWGEPPHLDWDRGVEACEQAIRAAALTQQQKEKS